MIIFKLLWKRMAQKACGVLKQGEKHPYSSIKPGTRSSLIGVKCLYEMYDFPAAAREQCPTSSEELMAGPLSCRSSKDVLLCTGAGNDVLHGGAPAISSLW